jgi:hypothetical protein
MADVAADVSPLIIPAGEKLEPTHIGCYGAPQFAIRNGQGFFSGLHFGLDDWGIWRLNLH